MLQNVHALRGVACLLVVWLHLIPNVHKFGIEYPAFDSALWFGASGVDLFFVLSGFIIAHTNASRLGSSKAVPGYLWKRFWRIYPVYWAALALAVAVNLPISRSWVLSIGWERWLRMLTLVPSELGTHVIAQAWTLTYEVTYYLVFAAILALPRAGGRILFLAWVAAVILYSTLGLTAFDHPFDAFALEFASGVAIAWLARRGKLADSRVLAAGAMLAFVAAMCLAIIHCDGSYSEFLKILPTARWRVALYGPPAVLLVASCIAADREGRRPHRIMLRIGDASYSIYLTHGIGIYLCEVMWILCEGRIPRVPWLLATIASSIGIGLIFHRLVERPLLRLGNGSSRKDASTKPVVISFSTPTSDLVTGRRDAGVDITTARSVPATAHSAGCR